MQLKYQVNPLDKIREIENPKVRELCRIVVEEAIEETSKIGGMSNSAIEERLVRTLEINSANLISD